MKRITIELYGSYVSCDSDSCTLQKLCTNHRSAGDFRSEYGVRPELQGATINPGGVSTAYCKTYNVTYESSYDTVHNPDVVAYGEYVSLDEISAQLPLF